jgi:2-dehydro-3-deoxygluconokinase
MMKCVVTFGEIMMRMSCQGHQRFRQTLPGALDVTFAGAEANVAVSLSLLGQEARFVTALPKTDIADACIGELRNTGVDTSEILRTEKGRFGIYFVETGADQRGGKVVYDRDEASVSLMDPSSYDWDAIFQDAVWFHTSGITPALSSKAAQCCLVAVQEAKKRGLSVSFDLNYRGKLWNWDEKKSKKELARSVAAEILPFVDVVIGNEGDADDMLGIRAGESDVEKGKLDIDRYPAVAAEIIRRYPNVSIVATTLRESLSASRNRWGAMLYDGKTGKRYLAPMGDDGYAPYDITDIVDRIGGGDSFSAALVYAMNDKELSSSLDDVLAFAVASSCLCHTIEGDFNYVSKDEVLALMHGGGSGRVQR